MKKLKIVVLFSVLAFSACIEEDIIDDSVAEEVRIISSFTTLKVGEIATLEASFFNNVGELENNTFIWSSSNPSVLSIDATTSSVIANSEGTAIITAKATGKMGDLTDSQTIEVVANNSIIIDNPKKGTFSKTTSYKAAGDFEITKTSTGIKIELASNYVADTSLPGFALFLTNNPNSLASALQIDAYDDADGAHYTGAFTYNISNVGLNDYKYLVQWCRPFAILTGKAQIIDK
ncbi:Ig-like domain-containing protein [Polaribacter gangjinensis]|uniref:DM13 domain-containing protein n=1 Tax=Polaribacter gangjinensis TaxID=574710 RepID=A0A2S7WEK9_9FLAO|nr:hypothetical protein [Polaribacter gangjinensis]PQJ76027.1 hypothetical protein BTO13_12685 [Polaribacter gangjinensis]